MSYAEGTSVSVERSQMEIASMIRKYGAQSFGTGWNAGHALVTFNAHDRQIRFVLPIAENWREFITCAREVESAVRLIATEESA